MCYRQCDGWLAACASSAKPRLSICHQLPPPADEEQLSAAQFWNSNRHHQRRGECWPTTQQAFRSNVALHIARCVDTIVLQVDWWCCSEHLFTWEDEVDRVFRELRKQQLRSLQVSFAVGARQLLYASLLKALEMHVFVKDMDHWEPMNALLHERFHGLFCGSVACLPDSTPVHQQDQCYQLCGWYVISHCWDDGQPSGNP